jgi:hypothetical protein
VAGSSFALAGRGKGLTPLLKLMLVSGPPPFEPSFKVSGGTIVSAFIRVLG